MVAAKGGIAPQSWARTADYILDTKGSTTHGEKVASYRVTNCGTDDPGDATAQIQATQGKNAKNGRSKSDPTYHLVFSFPPGEHPPLEVLHAIEDELCEAIGYADHQRISAVHIDTDHLHVHVAINKVHPTGLQNIEPYYDKKRLMETCERLEIKYGLQRTNHGLNKGKENDRAEREPIRLDPKREYDSRFREFLYQSYHLKITEPPEAKTDSLHGLSGSGVARRLRRYSELLPGDARNHLQQGGPERVDRVRRSRDGAGSDGERGGNVTTGLPGNMEAHAGVESLIGYVAREVAPAMRRAATWQELHAALAEHGLQIKQRGAGLVIGDAGLGLWCKASAAGRDLSAKALADRLGPFELPAENSRPHDADPSSGNFQRRYAPRPRQQHPASARLFTEYQRERQASIATRRQAIDAERGEIAHRRAALKKWAATQRTIVKVSARGAEKKMMYMAIRAQVAAQKAAIAADAANQRKGKAVQVPKIPSWNEWLMGRAERGDVEALAVLRSRAQKGVQLAGDLLTAGRAEQAKNIILTRLRPIARADGAISYRTADGGLVVDRTSHVQAKEATTGAAFVALTVAAERFEGQALQVKGSDAFRRDVARLAGFHSLGVQFADPELEAIRRAEGAKRTPVAERPEAASTQTKGGADRPSSQQPKAPQGPFEVSPAVLEWIEKRNSQREAISSIDYNRLWAPTDAGPATYQGRRRLADGTEVLLLKRGGEMLVKPASANVVAKATRWRVGKQVALDARGRFVGVASKGQEL